MKTVVRLKANESFTVHFASRPASGSSNLQFAWVHVVGEVGDATVEIVENGSALPSAPVPVPGMFSSVIHHSSPPKTTNVTITALSKGFLGVFAVKLLWRI